jgi:hypothetical protein
MGRHHVQQARSPVHTAVNTAAISGAMLWIALSAAGTASANTHHGANAPGDPFGGFPVFAPAPAAGVVPSSTTSIVRHSTGTSPGTGGTTPGSSVTTALVNGQPASPGVVVSSTTSIVRHSTGAPAGTPNTFSTARTPSVAGPVASSGLTTSTPVATGIQNTKPGQTGAGAAASMTGTKPSHG